MTRDRRLRITFDEIAELYDEVRLGYPEPLIEDILALARIPSQGRILEIGCGPGQATLPFARRGYSMLCLELGSRLAALAAEHCGPYPGVEILNTSFEEWPLQGNAFDLVISAEAFHWIPSDIGYAKAAAALKDGGSLALFWRHTAGQDTPFRRAVEQAYRERAPHLVEHLPGKTPSDVLIERTLDDFHASGCFGPVVTREHAWSATATAEQHVKLVSTYSFIHNLPESVRRDLLADIRQVIEDHGGQVTSTGVVVLYVARIER